MLKPFLVLASLFLLSQTSLGGNVILVDSAGGGQYTDIQTAINASQDGDLILVRAGGPYLPFTLNKGVMVRAETVPFQMDQRYSGPKINAVPPGMTAGIAGMRANGFSMKNSLAMIVLENIELDGPLVVNGCKNVLISNLAVDDTITIVNSRARLSDVQAKGWWQPEIGDDGYPAMLVQKSYVELTRPNLSGGTGGPSESCPFQKPGGDGGPGLAVDRGSTVVISGTEQDVIQGGAGGTCDVTWRCNPPGNGGNGIQTYTPNDVVLISRVTLLGGPSLFCSSPVGAPSGGTGQVTRLDTLAHLNWSGDPRIGNQLQIHLDGTEPGDVFFLVSDQVGFQSLSGILGHQLGAIPGGLYFFFGVGPADAQGDFQVQYSIPPDTIFLGVPLVFQAGLLASPSGNAYLTNVLGGIIGV